MADEPRSGPLAGVRVIDMSTVVLGPYATLILGDLGADVIKIETGAGDIMRHAGKAPAAAMGPIYMALNRNKRSVKLNLRQEQAKEAMRRLLRSADVFFHNVRQGGIERLGFDYETVKALNPSIVYVHCVGYGSNGTYAGRQAYDDLVQAASGFADLLSQRDKIGGKAGEPTYMPSLIADKTAGLHAVYATLAALFHRQRTGEGQFVEVPMLETFTMFHLVENLYGRTFVPPTGRMAYTRSVNPNRRPYPTKDGYIAIVPYSDDQWAQFFEMGGRPGVMSEPRFATYEARTEHIGELYALIREVARTKTTEEWLKLLGEAHIPAMRYNRLEDVLEEEHLTSAGFFQTRTHPDVGDYVSMRHPVRFERSAASIGRDPPRLGADTEEVLRGLGLTEPDVAALTAAKGSE